MMMMMMMTMMDDDDGYDINAVNYVFLLGKHGADKQEKIKFKERFLFILFIYLLCNH